MLKNLLQSVSAKRLLMFVLVMGIMTLLGAPVWGQVGVALIFAYLAFPESRSFHIASSKIITYFMAYNEPRAGLARPGDLWHKIDENTTYIMDGHGKWKVR
jgi:hypothetical protein